MIVKFITPILYLAVVLLSFSSKSFAQTGPDLTEYINMCKTVDGAYNAYRYQVSTPPVLGGEIYRTTVADMCDLLVQLQKLQNKAEHLNQKLQGSKLTEASWEQRILLAASIWHVANSKHHIEQKPTDIGEIETQRERQALADFYRTITNEDQINVGSFEHNAEQEKKMNEFAIIARERSMLRDSLDCPDNSDNPDFQKEYENSLRYLSIERERYRLKREHYYGRLREIGPTFLRDDSYGRYFNKLRELHENGIVIRTVEAQKSATRHFKTGKANSDGTAEIKTKSSQHSYQKFYSLTDERKYEEFRAEWKSRWKDHVDQTFDTLDLGMNKLDACIRDPRAPKTNIFNPTDVNIFASEERRCINALLEERQTPKAFFFDEVIDRYKEASLHFSALQAQIWTKESELLLRPIKYDETQTGLSLNDGPNCADDPLSYVKLQEIRVKMLNTENAYKEIIARELIKDSMIRDEELRRQQEIAEEIRAKEKILERDRREKLEDLSKPSAPSLGGSL